MVTKPVYRGRFAPSPTGPLHFGSLVAAVASYCEATVHGGEWLVRIEDLDPPRTVRGAADSILKTLEDCGFAWDGELVYQSRRADAYERALQSLQEKHLLYPCACSRREIADSALHFNGEAVYPGTCRNGLPAGRQARSWRIRVPAEPVEFIDAVQGVMRQSLQREVGDFVVRRADGCYAYQLAVVVDDAAQGITDIVRGADLLGSTPRQIYLQRQLGLGMPSYAHVPVAVDRSGEKLSKQTLATPIGASEPARDLVAALRFLGQEAPAGLARANPQEVWSWARSAWRLERVPRVRERQVESG